jgi:hypothetical protein
MKLPAIQTFIDALAVMNGERQRVAAHQHTRSALVQKVPGVNVSPSRHSSVSALTTPEQ